MFLRHATTKAVAFSALLVAAAALSCAHVERVAPPTSAPRRIGESVFQVGWTHRVMPHIKAYRDRANPIQGAVPEVDRQDGRVFVGSADEHVYAFDAQTGRVLWRKSVGAAVRSQPLFMPETQVIFVGTDDGELLALGADDGDERWSYQAEGEIRRQPVIDGEALYVSSADDTVHAIDWTNGTQIWVYHHEGRGAEFEVSGHAGVAVDNGLVFTGFSDGTVAALDAFDGQESWTRDLTEDVAVAVSIGGIPAMPDVDTTPVLGKRRIYVASYEAGIYALNRDSGAVVWREPTKSVIALSGRGSTLFAAQAGEGLLALDTSDGRVCWRRDLGPATYYRPVVFRDLLIVPDSEVGMTALRWADGSIVQRYSVGSGAGGAAEVAGSTAFVLSNGGTLAALRLH